MRDVRAHYYSSRSGPIAALPSPVLRLDPIDALTRESEALRRRPPGAPESPWVLVWESAYPCVILPRRGAPSEWVYVDRCRDLGVPVFRRESGGGSVVLGPGCVTVSVVVSVRAFPALQDVRWSYEWLLGVIADVLSIPGVERRGTDLLIGERKFAGHAQRRVGDVLLHHGAILYDFDLGLIERVLPEPIQRPTHRGERTHREFLTNVPVIAPDIHARLRGLSSVLATRVCAGRFRAPA